MNPFWNNSTFVVVPRPSQQGQSSPQCHMLLHGRHHCNCCEATPATHRRHRLPCMSKRIETLHRIQSALAVLSSTYVQSAVQHNSSSTTSPVVHRWETLPDALRWVEGSAELNMWFPSQPPHMYSLSSRTTTLDQYRSCNMGRKVSHSPVW
jgi:hypothetical protein